MPCHGSAPQAAASSGAPADRKCCERTDGTCCLDAAALDTTLDAPNHPEQLASTLIVLRADGEAGRHQEGCPPRILPGPNLGPPPISTVSILRL